MNVKSKEYPTFREVANDLSLLPYDPDHPGADGKIEIGCVEAGDGSVSRWSIVPRSKGYVILIEAVTDGYDDDWNPIPAKSPNPVYYIPVKDGSALGMDCIPTYFDDVEGAYRSFLEVVYTTERTEKVHLVRQKAHEIIGGYAQPETMSFPDFKAALEAVSIWDGRGRYDFTTLAGAMLCCRYPFLVSCSAFASEEISTEDFTFTEFSQLPAGWARRFGPELFEDLRNQAWDPDPLVWEYRLCETRIEQIKEKYGELRVYCSCWGEGGELIEVYTYLSRSVCILCGKADSTRITRGYISPYCYKEALGDRYDRYDRRSESMDKYLPKDADMQDKLAAYDYSELSTVLPMTSPAASSKEVSGILDEWIVSSYSKDGEKKANRAIGLLDGTPAPNGEPIWARVVTQGIAADIRKLEEWCDRGFVDDDGSGPGSLTVKYDAPALDWGWDRGDADEDIF